MHERQSPFAYLFSDTDEVLHVAGFRARIQRRWPGSRQWPPVTLGEMLTSGPDFAVCPKAGGECSLNRSLITQGRRMVYMRKDIFFT